MSQQTKSIAGGIYLVIDPSMPVSELLGKLKEVLDEGVAVVQIWDNWVDGVDQTLVIQQICDLCHAVQVPVVINNAWQLLNTFPLDGVHFDAIPNDFAAIQQAIGRKFIAGITCTNNLDLIRWAVGNQLDYVSFCSLFPSTTSNSCELVSFDTIRQAREITEMPIFLAGGIRLDNMHHLSELPFDGVAIVSGIMGAAQPASATKQYKELLTKTHHASIHHR